MNWLTQYELAPSPLLPAEVRCTAEERGSMTFGDLAWRYERVIEGVFAGAGYLCQRLPETDRTAHEMAQKYSASDLCNTAWCAPHLSFRCLVENRALASIRISDETMHYFLNHSREQLQKTLPIVPPSRQPIRQRDLVVLSENPDRQFPPEWPPAEVDAGWSVPENGVQL